MVTMWLQAALVFGLALAAWISGLDAHGPTIEVVLLWAASAAAATPLVLRVVAGRR